MWSYLSAGLDGDGMVMMMMSDDCVCPQSVHSLDCGEILSAGLDGDGMVMMMMSNDCVCPQSVHSLDCGEILSAGLDWRWHGHDDDVK